jgi:hypothetical protein
MSGLEPLPLFPCPVLSLARCFRGDDGDHSSSTVLIVVFRWFNPRLLFSKSKKTVKTYYWPKRHVWRRLGPFSSSLLPLLEAADTFGRVVMAAVVMVVLVIVVLVVDSSLRFFVTSSLVITYNWSRRRTRHMFGRVVMAVVVMVVVVIVVLVVVCRLCGFSLLVV